MLFNNTQNTTISQPFSVTEQTKPHEINTLFRLLFSGKADKNIKMFFPEDANDIINPITAEQLKKELAYGEIAFVYRTFPAPPKILLVIKSPPIVNGDIYEVELVPWSGN